MRDRGGSLCPCFLQPSDYIIRYLYHLFFRFLSQHVKFSLIGKFESAFRQKADLHKVICHVFEIRQHILYFRIQIFPILTGIDIGQGRIRIVFVVGASKSIETGQRYIRYMQIRIRAGNLSGII